MKNCFPPLPLFFACFTLPASAVIVAGASGGGNTTNNTTAAQYLSETGQSLPVYDNVIQYSDASGIYLGYNAINKDVWVLTARHVSTSATQGDTVTIGGLTYNRKTVSGGDGYGLLPGGDLRLVCYSRADFAVPTLPAVSLSSTVPVAVSDLVMIGYGQNRTQNATTNRFVSDAVAVTVGTGYNWSGTTIKRWGTNQIEAEFLDGLEATGPVTGTTGTFSMGTYSTIGYMTDFDQPVNGQWLNSNEAQGSLGDSGGTAFYESDGQWYLSGVFSKVAAYSGQAGNTAAFGNLSMLTDVASYSTTINTLLGGITLVPEPSSSVLILFAGTALLTRRRRVCD